MMFTSTLLRALSLRLSFPPDFDKANPCVL
jgi:hypothetical protein